MINYNKIVVNILLLYLQVFLITLVGRSVRPLGITYDPDLSVRKLLDESGEDDQHWEGERRRQDPDGSGYTQRRPSAHPRPQRVNYRHIPVHRTQCN